MHEGAMHHRQTSGRRTLSFSLVAFFFLAPPLVAQTPPEVDSLDKQAYSLYQNGDLDGAAAAFRQAISLNARDGLLYFGLGMVLAEKGSLPEAAQAYENAVSLIDDQYSS